MKKTEQNEKALVTLASRGERSAFNVLIQKYQGKVSKLIGYYVEDPHEILDLTQETFFKAYNAIREFRAESSFYTWLYRIAINTAKEHRRSTIVRREESIAPINPETEKSMDREVLIETTTPENHLLSDERTKIAFSAMERLSPDLKMTFYLRELEGLTYYEIGKIMDCPVGTVRSRLSRARAAIVSIGDPQKRPH